MVKRPLTFIDGVCVGLGAAMFLALLWLVVQTNAYAHMYRDFGNAHLPELTRIVLSTPWQFGAPAAVLALAAVALVTRARAEMIALPIVAVVLIAVTYHGLFAPITQLATDISY